MRRRPRARSRARRASWRSARSRRSAAGPPRELLPFPALRYGWGLDLHWAALAAERGWRLGIVDALPVRHEQRPGGGAYGHAEAIEEAQRLPPERRPYAAERAGVGTLGAQPHFRP